MYSCRGRAVGCTWLATEAEAPAQAVGAVTTAAWERVSQNRCPPRAPQTPALGLIRGRLGLTTPCAHGTSLFVMQRCSPPSPFKMQPATSNCLLNLPSQSFSIQLISPTSTKGFSFSFYIQVLKILVHNFSIFPSSLCLWYKLLLRGQVAVGL